MVALLAVTCVARAAYAYSGTYECSLCAAACFYTATESLVPTSKGTYSAGNQTVYGADSHAPSVGCKYVLTVASSSYKVNSDGSLGENLKWAPASGNDPSCPATYTDQTTVLLSGAGSASQMVDNNLANQTSPGIGRCSQSAALTGNWGCLGTTTFSFVAKGTTQPQTITQSQMMRLVVSSTGTVSATILFGESGAEICQFAATGSISVNALGFGVLSLTFNPNVPDEDKDTSFNCGAFYGRTTTITESFHIVTVTAGTQFKFIGKDDFFTPETNDSGDFFAASGQCLLQ